MTRTRVNMTVRPADLALLDAMAEAEGLSRGQLVESLVRREVRRVCDAGPEKGSEVYGAVRGALSRIAEWPAEKARRLELGALIGVGTGPLAREDREEGTEWYRCQSCGGASRTSAWLGEISQCPVCGKGAE